MQVKTLWLVSVFLLGCSTQSKFIPIPEDANLKWNDKYDSVEWRKKFKECQGFLHQDNDAWHWCMNNE